MRDEASIVAPRSPRPPNVPTGNVYDKYGSSNRVERMLVEGFFGAIDRCLPRQPPTRVLEAGLGEGEVSSRLRRRWRRTSFVGIDLPDLELASHWSGAGLLGCFADIAALPFPDRSFDVVVTAEVLEHVPDPEAALRELARVAIGPLILTVPREPIWRVANLARGKYLGALGNTPGHVQHWSTRSFRQLVAGHLDVERVLRPFPWTVVAARRR